MVVQEPPIHVVVWTRFKLQMEDMLLAFVENFVDPIHSQGGSMDLDVQCVQVDRFREEVGKQFSFVTFPTP